MAKQIWTKQVDAVTALIDADKDDVAGTIRHDGANGCHLLTITLPSVRQAPGESYSFRADMVVEPDRVLTRPELDAFLATWRKLRDAAFAAKGYSLQK